MIRHLELVMAETGLQPSVRSNIWEGLISAHFARSRNAASMRVCHRSGGSKTLESDERIRGSIGISFLTLIVGSTFGNRPIAVKVSAVSDPFPAAVKVGLASTWAEPRRHANGRDRRD